MSPSKIEWTEETWNPLVGCEYASPGCLNCYAARDAAGRLSKSPVYVGLATREPGEPAKFTGEIRLLPDRLDKPLHWREPRKVFANSMSDLFHPDVPVEFVAEVFAVMTLASQHTYQLLTKRPRRMRGLLSDPEFVKLLDDARERRSPGCGDFTYPLPNVWLGTSVESQRYADLRIPDLLATPAAIRWVSAEPLLGALDLGRYLVPLAPRQPRSIDWIVVGGESGPRARPMHPEWVRDLRDQATERDVAFLVKQWGEWSPNIGIDEWTHRVDPITGALSDRPSPEETRAEALAILAGDAEDSGWAGMRRVGKGNAGRTLDGVVWDQYPEAAA